MMDNKEQYVTAVECPFCKSLNNPYAFETIPIAGKSVELGLNNCKKCRLHYISPRLSGEGLSLLYDTSYLEATVSGQYNTVEDVSHNEYLCFRRYIQKFAGDTTWKLIDVGCGVGNLIDTLSDLKNIHAEGVEFSDYAFSCAHKKGLKVQKGDLLELEYEKEYFDCVTIMYVLEHVPKPLEVLKKTFSMLRQGGYLMVAVPNLRYLSLVNAFNVFRFFTGRKKTLHPQEHLQNYTPSTLRAFIETAGFDIRYIGLASPLRTGAWYVRIAKSIAWLPFYLLYRLGYSIGGIHMIAQKKPA